MRLSRSCPNLSERPRMQRVATRRRLLKELGQGVALTQVQNLVPQVLEHKDPSSLSDAVTLVQNIDDPSAEELAQMHRIHDILHAKIMSCSCPSSVSV